MNMKRIITILFFGMMSISVIAQSISHVHNVVVSIDENITYLHENALKPHHPQFQLRYLKIMQALPSAGLSSAFETSLTSEYTRKYDGAKDYRYDQEVMIMYIFGQIMYEIEYDNPKRNYESAYFALNYMLDYYKRLVALDPQNRNMLFERYLKERVKDELYAKMKVRWIPS